MNIKRTLRMAAFAICAIAIAPLASAGTIVLEGSDASTFHGEQEGGAEYATQLIAFMQGGSSLPIVVLGTGGLASAVSGSVVYTTDLSGLDISLYSGLYIMSPGGCCSQNLAGASVYAAEITAFVAAGGSVAIQDYTGGDWSFVHASLGTPPAGTIMGFDTGGGGPSCTDNQVFNNEALIRGFVQPPPLGCWEHQAYDNDYFGALGYLSLVDADPVYFGLNADGSARGSAFLALGGALGTEGCTNPAGCETSVPEPGTLALLGIGILGLGLTRRRRKV